ncbi:13817_t:CDS:2 [Funneliformis geosporum]|nr:13817_t:CDS:2 [Funneliformis geosporum]
MKLADFGLSKRIEAATNQSNTFELLDDFYSVGVLLWELSSGRPPFYVKDEEYNISLTIEILGGLREKIIPDTPEDYLNIYTGIIKLNAIIAITSIASIAENNQSNNYKSNLQQHFCVT